MTSKTFEEQAASLVTESFKDGELSDGAPTPEEEAAAAANAPKDNESEEEEAAAGESEEEDAAGAAEDAAGESEAAEGEKDPEKAAKEPKEGEKPAKKSGKSTAAERISDLTAKMRSEQRRADSLEARLRELEAGGTQKSGAAPLTGDQSAANSGDTPPDPSKFDYGELDPKYIAALARHETAQALKAQKAEDDKTRQAQAADEKRQEQAQKQDVLVKAGVKLFDDFDEVVMQGARDGAWELTRTLGELILDDPEFGPRIAYELAKDPDESRRVAKLSEAQQAAYFGKQQAKFEAAKPSQRTAPKTPQAPPPPKTPKGGSGSNKVGADSTDFAAVEKAWQSGAL